MFSRARQHTIANLLPTRPRRDDDADMSPFTIEHKPHEGGAFCSSLDLSLPSAMCDLLTSCSEVDSESTASAREVFNFFSNSPPLEVAVRNFELEGVEP